jgi:hypothetical protein
MTTTNETDALTRQLGGALTDLATTHRLYELAVRDRARLREALEELVGRCDGEDIQTRDARRALNETGADK